MFDSISTSLRDIKQKEDACVEMSQGSDSLHLNSVSLVQGMVKNTRGVNYLPFGIFIFGVSNEKTLSGESIWLHIDIGL